MPAIHTDVGGASNNMADASYSMLFSPAASSLASTPGGGLGGVGGDGMHDQQDSHQQQQQLEIHWEPTAVKAELLQASAILSHRCLKLASKWAAEQVVGIPVGQPVSLQYQPQPEEDGFEEQPNSTSATAPRIQPILQDELLNMTEQDWYAKSLVELGEYLHGAAVLSQEVGSKSDSGSDSQHYDTMNNDNNDHAAAQTADITQMGPPLSGLSSYGLYLRAYALYMAGERRKEEEFAGLERYARTHSSSLLLNRVFCTMMKLWHY